MMAGKQLLAKLRSNSKCEIKTVFRVSQTLEMSQGHLHWVVYDVNVSYKSPQTQVNCYRTEFHRTNTVAPNPTRTHLRPKPSNCILGRKSFLFFNHCTAGALLLHRVCSCQSDAWLASLKNIQISPVRFGEPWKHPSQPSRLRRTLKTFKSAQSASASLKKNTSAQSASES